MREIVAALTEDSDLLKRAQSVLSALGMVSGAYGFAEQYGERKPLPRLAPVKNADAVSAAG